MKYQLDSIQKAMQSQLWWYRNIIHNNPQGAANAMRDAGIDVPENYTEQSLETLMKHEVQLGQQAEASLRKHLYKVLIDHQAIDPSFYQSLGVLGNAAKRNLLKSQQGEETVEENGGFDWGNMQMWGDIANGVFAAIGGAMGQGNNGGSGGGPSPTDQNGNGIPDNQESGYQPNGLQDDDETNWPMWAAIGVIGLFVVGLVVSSAINASRERKLLEELRTT